MRKYSNPDNIRTDVAVLKEPNRMIKLMTTPSFYTLTSVILRSRCLQSISYGYVCGGYGGQGFLPYLLTAFESSDYITDILDFSLFKKREFKINSIIFPFYILYLKL